MMNLQLVNFSAYCLLFLLTLSGGCSSRKWKEDPRNTQEAAKAILLPVEKPISPQETTPKAVLLPVEGSISPIELDHQNEYERVRFARSEKNEDIIALFTKAQVIYPPKRLFLRAFKGSIELELWAQGTEAQEFQLIKTYNFSNESGTYGPKRKQGDAQIPEGVYRINRFNPMSHYYLSLGLNYPNKSDRILGSKNPGGDIFIHGDGVVAGCIPIADNEIKELYIIALDAYSKGNPISVHIFPMRMDAKNMRLLKEFSDKYDSSLFPLWQSLKRICDFFERSHLLPRVDINTKGAYLLREDAFSD